MAKNNEKKRRLHSLKRKLINKMEMLYLNGGDLKDNTVITVKTNGRKVSRKVVCSMAATALTVSMLVPATALAQEVQDEEITDNTPIEMVIDEKVSNDNSIEVMTNETATTSVENVSTTNDVEAESNLIENVNSTEELNVNKENVVSETSESQTKETEEKDVVSETNSEDETEKLESTNLEANNEDKENVQKNETATSETTISESTENKETDKNEAAKTNYMDVTSIRPGVNVSDKEDEVKYVVDKDTTYMVITTKDGKQVIYNIQDLGNPNVDKLVENYNNLSDNKIKDDFQMVDYVDEEGNVYIKTNEKLLYPQLDKNGLPIYDENGEVIYFESEKIEGREDGIYQYDKVKIGQYTIDPVTGEKVFTAEQGTEITFGTNELRQEEDPDKNYQTSKPIVPPYIPPEEPENPENPVVPDTPKTPTEGTTTGKLAKTGLSQTGDIKRMVINGLEAVVLASGLILTAAAYAGYRKNEETKKLILK